jgi:hypothetical protein
MSEGRRCQKVGDVSSKRGGDVVETLTLFGVGYLLLGIGVGIGRWDFDPEEHEGAGIAVVLVLAIALVWPWLVWQRRNADRSLDERYG